MGKSSWALPKGERFSPRYFFTFQIALVSLHSYLEFGKIFFYNPILELKVYLFICIQTLISDHFPSHVLFRDSLQTTHTHLYLCMCIQTLISEYCPQILLRNAFQATWLRLKTLEKANVYISCLQFVSWFSVDGKA